MAEHLRDLGHRRAVTDHPRREAMAEEVRDTTRMRTDAGALEGEPNDVVDRAWTR